jgi:hypothetical protein
MAEHEPSIGMSDDWFTPPEIFTALDLTFELDPCSPGPGQGSRRGGSSPLLTTAWPNPGPASFS